VGIKLELLTKENCHKCDWVKENVLPALRLKGYEVVINDYTKYPTAFYVMNELNGVPVLIIQKDKRMIVMDKGLTYNNVERTIKDLSNFINSNT